MICTVYKNCASHVKGQLNTANQEGKPTAQVMNDTARYYLLFFLTLLIILHHIYSPSFHCRLPTLSFCSVVVQFDCSLIIKWTSYIKPSSSLKDRVNKYIDKAYAYNFYIFWNSG